jgi:hypothetical protein
MNESIAALWPELRFMSKAQQEREVIKKYESLVLRYPEIAEAMMSWAADRGLSESDGYHLSEAMRMVFLVGYTHGAKGIPL